MTKTRGVLFLAVVLTAVGLLWGGGSMAVAQEPFKLGNEILLTKYAHLIDGKKVGLVTNQSGLNSLGVSTIDVLWGYPHADLVALYGPEHGIDGKAAAGAYVESYTHPHLHIPVYSLYGATRMPTADMLKNIDTLVYDIQDIGARSYTYISTLNYCMKAAKENHKSVVVLDRPNPLGGIIVEGPVMEDRFKTFVGVDNLPMAHGMTVGELARFFNRSIGVDLTVVPMEGYSRDMIYDDTGLSWIATSPNIPGLESMRGYMACGQGEGTGIFQADQFRWIGGKNLDANAYALKLNQAGLPGVNFVPETRGEAGGVRLQISNPRTFNPAKTGVYALAYAYILGDFTVPQSGPTTQTIVMFDKIMGTDKMGAYFKQKLTPQEIEAKYAAGLNDFKQQRQKYLIYGADKGGGTGTGETIKPAPAATPITIKVYGQTIGVDAAPYVDANNRTMVPLRAVSENLGAVVEYDALAKTIAIVKGDNVVILILGSTVVTVDGASRQIDTTPVIKNNRTMVPLRYVGEFLGAQVQWHADTRTVTVD